MGDTHPQLRMKSTFFRVARFENCDRWTTWRQSKSLTAMLHQSPLSLFETISYLHLEPRPQSNHSKVRIPIPVEVARPPRQVQVRTAKYLSMISNSSSAAVRGSLRIPRSSISVELHVC